MKAVYPVVAMLTIALSLSACGGEEKQTETAKTQAAAPAKAETVKTDTAQASQVETKSAEAQVDEAKPEAATEATKEAPAKTELVKPASLEVGKKRYETTCHVCHEAGLLNAPKLSDKENWAIRAKQGVEVLYQHSAKGIRSMPAQATGDVSEAEVYAAVDYMLSQAK